MNSAYIGKLMELAEKDRNIIHILADSGTGFDEIFRKNFPDQIINFGIAEQNMVSAASGMAAVGKIPFVFTAGAFLAYRSLEFIRNDVCFQNLNVKLVGMGSGLSWSSLGPTHHTTEDVSVLRALPNLMILSPGTPIQVGACVSKAYEHNGPVYIKIEMNHEKELFDRDYSLNEVGQDIIKIGKDILIFTTGSILEEVMKVSSKLELSGRSVGIVNVVTLKPFDKHNAIKCISNYDYVFAVEEHNIHGGLAGILAESVAFEGIGKKIIPIGLHDRFAEGYGSHEMVRRANCLDAVGIYDRIMEHLQYE